VLVLFIEYYMTPVHGRPISAKTMNDDILPTLWPINLSSFMDSLYQCNVTGLCLPAVVCGSSLVDKPARCANEIFNHILIFPHSSFMLTIPTTWRRDLMFISAIGLFCRTC